MQKSTIDTTNIQNTSSEEAQNSPPITDSLQETVIKLRNISKKYNLYNNRKDRLKEALHPRRKKYHREFYALKDINLEVKKGEILGIVGKNGSGKSTLLKIISNILTPTTGSVEIKGKVVALLELGAGFNPEFTGMENIYFYCSLLGYSRKEIDALVPQIVDFAEIEEFIQQPIKTYSSGMKARLGFAVSVNVDPDILILDEVLAVGDELFRRKCFAKMEEFFKGGKTVLFVSHAADSVNELCTRAILLDRGECILEGPAKMVTMYYQRMLYAVGGQDKQVRKEIIELNMNKSLKHLQYNELKRKGLNEKNITQEDLLINVQGSSAEKQAYIKSESIMKSKAYYIPDFKPKSMIEYKNYNVDIYDIKITTRDEQIVNSLVTGEDYIYSYKVRFNEAFKKVHFGMLIKSEKGLSLTGCNTRDIDHSNNFQKNDVISVKWLFKCVYLGGTYYTNCGVSFVGKNNSVTFLNRIVDAHVFKVQKEIINEIGIVSASLRCIINENETI